MFSTLKKPPQSDELLSDSVDVEQLRLMRVWHLCNVAWLTWLFFTLYSFMRGHTFGAWICTTEFVAIGIAIKIQRKQTNYRLVMNTVLSLTAVGLVTTSIMVPAYGASILFFPASILIASQLLGIREAFMWLMATIFAYTIFLLLAPLEQAGLSNLTRLDGMVLVFGVGACVFFCCQQGEEFFQERTRGLVNLSQQLREKAAHLHQLATSDALTGLVNRFQFQAELRDATAQAIRSHTDMALLVIDMDGFKEINDTLGHPVGDKALIEVARRLRQEFADEAVIARLGGDEFCLICRNILDGEYASELAQRASRVLTQRYAVGDFEFPLGASVGIAICPGDTTCDTELLACADTAMFRAKEQRSGFALYDKSMTEKLVAYRAMQEKLSMALERDEFFLVYQPQVCFQTNRITGVEALLRWRHDGQVVSPTNFVPLLEKSRDILPVGRWIIQQACRQMREWNLQGHDIEVSINLSAMQFDDDELIHFVQAVVDEFQIDPRRLDFEITESLLVDNVVKAIERLQDIKSLGAKISLDDFGTGYSSLAYLKQFPLDRLKIDREFVRDYPQADDGVIATSIVALAKAIGLNVMAEGVETLPQRDFLRSLECDGYQGYYFSCPVMPKEISSLIVEHGAAHGNPNPLSIENSQSKPALVPASSPSTKAEVPLADPL